MVIFNILNLNSSLILFNVNVISFIKFIHIVYYYCINCKILNLNKFGVNIKRFIKKFLIMEYASQDEFLRAVNLPPKYS